MSIRGKSFISIEDLSDADIEDIFRQSRAFKTLNDKGQSFLTVAKPKTHKPLKSFLIFQEPSTRTRASFEMACHNLGVTPILLSDIKNTSMVKGETLEETLFTLSHFRPDFMVLRHKGSAWSAKSFSIPVINAGFGSYEHPTQALIDAFTIKEQKGQIKGQKVLIIGDVLHSRVSNSNLKLLKRLGAEVAFCSPMSLFPKDDFWKDVKCFKNVNEAVQWADVVMCLRIQHERHGTSIGLSIAEYRDQYHLGSKQLDHLKKTAMVMHPGPCIFGVEMSLEMATDKRSCISTQVVNSLYIRAAVLSHILDFKWIGD